MNKVILLVFELWKKFVSLNFASFVSAIVTERFFFLGGGKEKGSRSQSTGENFALALV